MPYIKRTKRSPIDCALSNVCPLLEEEGDYNYAITILMHNYIQKNGLKYKNMNAIMGVVECAKEEFYRTVVAPYEDKKIVENGNISDLDKKDE